MTQQDSEGFDVENVEAAGDLGVAASNDEHVAGPPQSPRAELEAMLKEDESRLGDVYRLHVLQGMPPADVAAELNIETFTFVYQYKTKIDAILDGVVPASVTLRQIVASMLRSMLKKQAAQLTAGAVDSLTQTLQLVDQALRRDSGDAQAQVSAQTERQHEERAWQNQSNLSGIYVFSYGWYLENPVGDDGGNTLMKVGRAINVRSRLMQHLHGSRAHIPEPISVVRIYECAQEDLSKIEALFHRLLSTAGHVNPRRLGGVRGEVGAEWFQTNEAFLDAIAQALGLRTAYIGDAL